MELSHAWSIQSLITNLGQSTPKSLCLYGDLLWFKTRRILITSGPRDKINHSTTWVPWFQSRRPMNPTWFILICCPTDHMFITIPREAQMLAPCNSAIMNKFYSSLRTCAFSGIQAYFITQTVKSFSKSASVWSRIVKQSRNPKWPTVKLEYSKYCYENELYWSIRSLVTVFNSMDLK